MGIKRAIRIGVGSIPIAKGAGLRNKGAFRHNTKIGIETLQIWGVNSDDEKAGWLRKGHGGGGRMSRLDVSVNDENETTMRLVRQT